MLRALCPLPLAWVGKCWPAGSTQCSAVGLWSPGGLWSFLPGQSLGAGAGYLHSWGGPGHPVIWDTGGGHRHCQPPGLGPTELVTLPGVTSPMCCHQLGAKDRCHSGLLCSAISLAQPLHSTDGETETEGGRRLAQDSSKAGPGTRCPDAQFRARPATPSSVSQTCREDSRTGCSAATQREAWLPLCFLQEAPLCRGATRHRDRAARVQSSLAPRHWPGALQGEVGVNFPGGKAVRWVRSSSAHRPPETLTEARKEEGFPGWGERQAER